MLVTLSLCAVTVGAEEPGVVYPDVAPYAWSGSMDNGEQTPTGAAASQQAPSAAATPSYYHTTVESLCQAAVQQMENRTTTFTLGFTWNGEYGYEKLNEEVLDGIFAHTGVPTQGDYLYCNTKSRTWNYEGTYYYTNTYVYYYQLNFTVEYRETAWQNQQVNSAVDALLKQLNLNGYSDYAKAQAVHDYMVTNITYDHEGLAQKNPEIYSTYAAIIKKNVVCHGYASLFYRLMLELGVDCRALSGDANDFVTGPNSGDDDHSWNIVKLDGKWYYVDTTWDANTFEAGYSLAQSQRWFLVCKTNFPEHTPWTYRWPASFFAQYSMATSDYPRGTSPNGWYQKNGQWYYGQNGLDRAGWLQVGGKWFYLEKTGARVTGWKTIGTNRYFFNAYGEMLTGWHIIAGKYYYFHSDGVMYKGWLRFGSTYYFLRQDGSMATGWVQIAGKYYYFHSNGVMYRGWLNFSNTYYYMRQDGSMATGWAQIAGKWYYFHSDGVMYRGWLRFGSTYYYMRQDGSMSVGWVKINNVWYYFRGSGVMATGDVKIGNKIYRFNANGVCLNP